MEIKQLKYFVAVVDNNCNISMAARKLYISQSTLTKAIKSFEEQENVLLFERSLGRLQTLTSVGKTFYENALKVLDCHNKMMSQLRESTLGIHGKIRIGIPPVIISVLFSKLLPKLINDFPNINFDIQEIGAFELQKKLLLDEVDFALLLSPTSLNPPEEFDQIALNDDVLLGVVAKNHPLSNKSILTWNDIKDEKISIFNDSFMIHHHIVKKFHSFGITPKIVFQSSLWDVMVESVTTSNHITFLPKPLFDNFVKSDVVGIPFDDPVPWIAIVCYRKSILQEQVNKTILDEILHYFNIV